MGQTRANCLESKALFLQETGNGAGPWRERENPRGIPRGLIHNCYE